TQVAVSPWKDAPGGGPLDIWLEAKGNRGDVRFVDSAVNGADSDAAPRLEFPRLFDAPLVLERASGRVRWIYDGPRSSVSGLNLKVGMNGASVDGSFGLVIGSEGNQDRGGFGLRLTMADVDAADQPLTGWLPMKLLREEISPELAEWLASGVAGRVPEGRLTLHLPLDAAGSHDADALESLFGLDLQVRDARLPFAADWPLIEDIEGRLALRNATLDARVDSAQSLGVVLTDGEVQLVDNVLSVTADLGAAPDAVARYLAAMPVAGMALAGDWQGEGRVDGQLALSLPLGNPEALTLDVETQTAVERLVHAPSGVTLRSLRGPLRWQQRGDSGDLQGRLEARLLGGSVTADIDTANDRLQASGRLAISELLALGAPPGAGELVSGQLPWRASVELDGSKPRVLIESGLEGVAIALPAPLGKAAEATRPLSLSLALADEPSLTGRLGTALGLRWRAGGGAGGQGQVWLNRAAPSAWPGEAGWSVAAYLPELVLPEWGRALTPLMDSPGGAHVGAGLRHLIFDTDCLRVSAHCLGSLAIDGQPRGAGWQLALDGSLLVGQLSYRPAADMALDVSLQQLVLDGLIPEAPQSGQGTLLGEVYVPPEPEPMPNWLAGIPNGRLRVAQLQRKGRRFGPLTAYWASTPESLTVSPVGLTLGEITAHGSLVWEAAGPDASLARARVALDGRNLGNALSLLGEQVAVTSATTRVTAQLAWPGSPWQFALARSRGSIEAELRDGRFVNIESPSARVIGLLNVDNLLRRLSLDFSDVTGRGTAFDRVSGAATLYGGVLETRGPINIEGPATNFALDGSVDLISRQLDQQLTITVPLSSNLPLAAVVAGAPVVGGALFIADKLLGDTIDRVTQLNYRVRGPWTSPQLSLERAE
ncbi:MAG TPA: AsmA-like C-terminal region-containing protein, partial [Halomonas sp.]|nr:AsmA-like C-terminal region-containing protein [Halomonas sp.]